MADSSILARLAALGITGDRATGVADRMDAGQVARASDAQLRLMVSGRESGDVNTGGHLFPNGHLYPA